MSRSKPYSNPYRAAASSQYILRGKSAFRNTPNPKTKPCAECGHFKSYHFKNGQGECEVWTVNGNRIQEKCPCQKYTYQKNTQDESTISDP